MTTTSLNKKMHKGFTLIELLIVIAIIAVLASAIVVLIDPVDKINSANDSKVISDIAQMAQAEQSYAAGNSGTYATSLSLLVPTELKILPQPPSNYMNYQVQTSGTNAGEVYVYGQVLSKKYVGTRAGTVYYQWCSHDNSVGTKLNPGNGC